MEGPIQEIAAEFAKVASRYCELIEAEARMSAEEFLRTLHTLIPALYCRASLLPEVEPMSDQLLPRTMTNEEWQELYHVLGAKLGKYNSHWEVFDPVEPTKHNPVQVSLADDLADIYRDLKRGVTVTRAGNGTVPTDVIWGWRYGFTSHWGLHAVDAMRAIHAHMFMHDLADDNVKGEDA